MIDEMPLDEIEQEARKNCIRGFYINIKTIQFNYFFMSMQI
jgi:hypothetical protein